MARSTIQRQTIAVDIDDVIAAHMEEFIRYSNEHFGTDITPETYSENYFTAWGLPLEETLARARQFHDDRLSSFEKIQEAEPVLKRLTQKYELVVVTARQTHNKELTHAWINKHFNGVFSDIHFVPIWVHNSTVTKADICKQIGADYLIDDQPAHCNVAAEMGITALLFGGFEWSKGRPTHKEVVRVDDWQKVASYFHV